MFGAIIGNTCSHFYDRNYAVESFTLLYELVERHMCTPSRTSSEYCCNYGSLLFVKYG